MQRLWPFWAQGRCELLFPPTHIHFKFESFKFEVSSAQDSGETVEQPARRRVPVGTSLVGLPQGLHPTRVKHVRDSDGIDDDGLHVCPNLKSVGDCSFESVRWIACIVACEFMLVHARGTCCTAQSVQFSFSAHVHAFPHCLSIVG